MATCSSADSVLDAASQIKSNATKLNTFVNGTASQTVQLGTGNPTPTLRNMAANAVSVVADAMEESITNDVRANQAAITALQSGKADKVSGATSGDIATLNASGNLVDSGVKPGDKADKVSSATSGHLAGLNASGNLTDSGIASSNVALKDTDIANLQSIKANKVANAVAGNLAELDASGDLVDSGESAASLETRIKEYVDEQSYGEASRSFLDRPWMQLFLDPSHPERAEIIADYSDGIIEEIHSNGAVEDRLLNYNLFLTPERSKNSVVHVSEEGCIIGDTGDLDAVSGIAVAVADRQATERTVSSSWMSMFLVPANAELREAVLTDENLLVCEVLADGSRIDHECEFKLFLLPERSGASENITVDESWREFNVAEAFGYGEAKGFLNPDVPIAAVWTEDSGDPVAVVETGGAVYFPAAASWPVPWIENGRVVTAKGEAGRLSAGTQVKAVFPFNARSFRISTQSMAGSLVDDGTFLPMIDGKTLHAFVIIGQSLSIGAQGFPLITTTPPVDGMCLMLDGDGVTDVRMGLDTRSLATITTLDVTKVTGFQNLIAVNSGRGQTFAESLAYAVAKREIVAGLGWKTLWMCTGVGGTAYSGLKKNTVAYTNAKLCVGRAKELAAGIGYDLVVEALLLKHGEADASNASYYSNLIEWQEDLEGDLKEITGQEKDIPMIIGMMSFMSTNQSSYRSSEAMLRAHVESPKHWLASVDYPYPYAADYVHLSGPGYHLLGEAMANAVLEASRFGGCEIVRMVSATRTGALVTVEFTVPCPPLAIDTEQITEREGTCRGFTYNADGTDIAVVSAEILDSGSSGVGTIRITLEFVPSGTENEVLRMARVGFVSGETKTEYTVARGNVRDSAGDRRKSSYDGRRLDNWAIHQQIPVTVE